ncbi:MAG: PhzF family phenazine biosynthesis protein [Actinobacteria bacterium]|nr:PhzF family phenazine biosynthesis protein [Thermoleophilia bacterium]MCB9010241.1 PhzF family phenazine biosynthesis protein [Actinomycetota bacterium]
MRNFTQVDVFTAIPYRGNPVAVVLDGDDLPTDVMQAFANWTNLSETTFVCSPTDPDADYRLRIFTPAREIPFAGHPTLGSCHAWLGAGGVPPGDDVVQQCAIGNVTIRRGDRLAFAAPAPRELRPLDRSEFQRACHVLGITHADVVDHHLLDNGPVFQVLLVRDAELVHGCRPLLGEMGDGHFAIAAPVAGAEWHLDLRMFAPGVGVPEDPVTGSLNAVLAQWLIGAGHMPPSYLARQGTALGRDGRVHIETVDDRVWVGGDTVTAIEGVVRL